MKRMLVNATQEEELRVALVDGQKLYDLEHRNTSREQKKANIYKGRISRVEPSLEACFVDYGAQRHGFLPLKEISKEYFRSSRQGGRMNIRELLDEGQELIVQVEKEERGNKGAALTTFISLAGRFLVLMPNNPRAGGVSRRIEGEDRDQMREVDGPAADSRRHGRHRAHRRRRPHGRGAAVGPGQPARRSGTQIDAARQGPRRRRSWSTRRAMPSPARCATTSPTTSARSWSTTRRPSTKAQEYMQRFMPAEAQRKLKLYDRRHPAVHALPDREPDRVGVRAQGAAALRRQHRHRLHRGAGLDRHQLGARHARQRHRDDRDSTPTSKRRTRSRRQLRIRDIGGLIVIDFIDMESQKNQRDVEDRLRDAVKMDRARIQIGRLSRFGLLEMSRQRLRPSLGESEPSGLPALHRHRQHPQRRVAWRSRSCA